MNRQEECCLAAAEVTFPEPPPWESCVKHQCSCQPPRWQCVAKSLLSAVPLVGEPLAQKGGQQQDTRGTATGCSGPGWGAGVPRGPAQPHPEGAASAVGTQQRQEQDPRQSEVATRDPGGGRTTLPEQVPVNRVQHTSGHTPESQQWEWGSGATMSQKEGSIPGPGLVQMISPFRPNLYILLKTLGPERH